MYTLTGAALVHRISIKQRKIEIVKTEMAIKQMSGELASNHQTKKKSSVKQPLLKLLFSPISFQLTAVPLQCWAQCEDQEGKKKKCLRCY